MTNNSINRFFLTSKLDKKQILTLLNDLPIESLVDIINISDKNALLALIKASFPKNQLKNIIYQSSLTDIQISNIIYTKKDENDKQNEEYIDK